MVDIQQYDNQAQIIQTIETFDKFIHSGIKPDGYMHPCKKGWVITVGNNIQNCIEAEKKYDKEHNCTFRKATLQRMLGIAMQAGFMSIEAENTRAMLQSLVNFNGVIRFENDTLACRAPGS